MEDSQNNGQEITAQPIENIVRIEDGHMFTTSLIIAQAFEKNHYDVLKAISNLECSPEFNERNFAAVEYKDAKGEMRPAYRLTRDGFAFLAMGFTGKKAAAWKEKFLEAFNAMETELLKRQVQEVETQEPENIPEQSERGAAEPMSCKFFYSRRKANKRQLEDMQALLRLEAVLQREDIHAPTSRLCQRMGINSLQDLPGSRVNEALHAIVSFLYEVRKGKEVTAASADFLHETLQGLISFWHRARPEYRENALKTYVCNRCNIDSLDGLENENEIFMAIIAIWGGINNHVFQTGCW